MKFKAGDRVHVTRLNGRDVNIYGILGNAGQFAGKLLDCKNGEFISGIYLPNSSNFGPNKTDYYTRATDEEDTEEPVIQRINDMYNDTHGPVNKLSHYMLGDIEVEDIIAIVADKYHKGSVAHNVASALEYQMRAPEKNGLEDIKKARKCLDFAIENWE